MTGLPDDRAESLVANENLTIRIRAFWMTALVCDSGRPLGRLGKCASVAAE